MGIIRAGLVAFPISTRNSAIGIATLLFKTNCTHLFVSEDAAMQNLARNALDLLQSENEFKGYPKVNKLTLPSFDYLFPEKDDNFTPLEKLKVASLGIPALILHSSGSLNFFDFSRSLIASLQAPLLFRNRSLTRTKY